MMIAKPLAGAEPGARKLFLIGGGKMGLALLNGWLKSGRRGQSILVVDPAPTKELRLIVRQNGIELWPSIGDEALAGTVVLATKPQIAPAVTTSIAPIVDGQTLVISIMAGTTLAALRGFLPRAGAVIRAMPNLPASVGRGVVVAVPEKHASEVLRTTAEDILEAAGAFEWLEDERLMDVVTGLSGSGPAYVFYLVDCLTQAGIKLGLDARVAERLARSTLEGTGELLHRSPETPKALREQVSSPNGTTQAGLHILMDGRLQELINATVEAAAARSRALSKL